MEKKDKRAKKEKKEAPLWEDPGRIPSDVQGSWTGTPEDGGRPIQDADDL